MAEVLSGAHLSKGGARRPGLRQGVVDQEAVIWSNCGENAGGLT